MSDNLLPASAVTRRLRPSARHKAVAVRISFGIHSDPGSDRIGKVSFPTAERFGFGPPSPGRLSSSDRSPYKGLEPFQTRAHAGCTQIGSANGSLPHVH